MGTGDGKDGVGMSRGRFVRLRASILVVIHEQIIGILGIGRL
jgi:hypothetical protein